MKYRLGEILLDVGAREDVVARCLGRVGHGGVIFTVNSLMAERAFCDADFLSVLNSSDLNTVDGVGVRVALALCGVGTDVLAGVELGEIITGKGTASLGIIGGREGVAERAFLCLKAKNPSLRRSFILSGFGKSDAEYLRVIAEKRPKICFICLGSPRQEYLAVKAHAISKKTLFLALGGSLDVYSGDKARAPKTLRRAGLEWLYRMVREPVRFAALPHLFSFLFRAFRTRRKNKQKSPGGTK